ncbi:MAG TPA: flagellar biosynthetic protein FliR [Rhizomicrobium sp.]|jgi:flagellar biosynthetic protein FliR|nr:flagellar biosynthetic protein FliR [Rhizomicrobium sp.]HEX4533182.1 flagellar biosynthetic protein FliR [Rhizomicrobium sp.]
MTVHLPQLSGLVLVYFLVFARTGAMIMLLPGVGEVGIPPRVRLALALAISFALGPVVAHSYANTNPQTLLQLGGMLIGEVTIGVMVGGMARIIMSSLSVAGTLIATQTGLASAQILDPTQGQQAAIFSSFFSMLGATLIFATNLHHLAINAIEGSYTLIPPGGALPTGDMAELAIRLVSGAFALGLELSAPFLVFGFAVYAALGVLAKMMPQLQVFFLAMPINIMVGFFLLMLLLGTMMTLFLNFYTQQMGAFQ